jgi:hypothetical protein
VSRPDYFLPHISTKNIKQDLMSRVEGICMTKTSTIMNLSSYFRYVIQVLCKMSPNWLLLLDHLRRVTLSLKCHFRLVKTHFLPMPQPENQRTPSSMSKRPNWGKDPKPGTPRLLLRYLLLLSALLFFTYLIVLLQTMVYQEEDSGPALELAESLADSLMDHFTERGKAQR